ncbi:MAG: DsbA family protein [Deinococcus sp.]
MSRPVLTALLSLLSLTVFQPFSASAQVGALLSDLLKQRPFLTFKQNGHVLTGPGGVRLETTLRGRYLEAATLTLPTPAPATSAAAVAAPYISALLGSDVSTPLASYLAREDVKAHLPQGLTVNAEPYDLFMASDAGGLRFRVSLKQVSGFAGVPASRTLGKASAPIVVRLYSDFQCPYCRKAELEAIPAVLRQLGPDVRFEFHHLPLEGLHPNARSAAEASVCAEQQGKFWPFKDALFRRTDWQELNNPASIYAAVAAQVGLNLASYGKCASGRVGRAEVDAGLAEAGRLHLNGTPSVFVNGYPLSDPYDPASYLRLISFVRGK